MAGISRCLTFLEDNMCDSVSSGYMDEYVFRLTNLRKEIKEKHQKPTIPAVNLLKSKNTPPKNIGTKINKFFM